MGAHKAYALAVVGVVLQAEVHPRASAVRSALGLQSGLLLLLLLLLLES